MTTTLFTGEVVADDFLPNELPVDGFLQHVRSWTWQGWLVSRAQFVPQPELVRLASRHHIVLPAQVCRAVPQRQAEYLAGRLLLRQLQLQLGLCTLQILPAADRSPQWPADQQGSLSHCGNELVAGLAAKPAYRLGVDLEKWLTQAQFNELGPAILSSVELHWCSRFVLQQQGPTLWSESQLLTLIFAAKEALYKALYPDCRQIMAFHAAEVRAVTGQQILLQLTVDWSATWCAGTEIWLDYQAEALLVQVLAEVRSR
ncbi:4'-phosphopantetheinyl transferase superfamily protein [Rheinheimera riviphila]|uniref:Enterobactin synthase component D n=1 Tax=Rheinheimera riviphila TaxID=1834037 RepID=A0A437R223_9GAMM|nr:4'-phosphopantetheinyl transferase superfamily protein [Rheinheimera riviphila]RVU40791.1 4'-phosphopantetheinyl transferase superfamily protein [Rheinheimera riviphila]